MASIVKSTRNKKRGRPIGSGLHSNPAHKSTVPARISPELWEYVQSEKSVNETISDTIFRLIRQARHDKIKARKNVDALQVQLREHLPEIESLTRYEFPLLNELCVIN